jgi:hypothetical protein
MEERRIAQLEDVRFDERACVVAKVLDREGKNQAPKRHPK